MMLDGTGGRSHGSAFKYFAKITRSTLIAVSLMLGTSSINALDAQSTGVNEGRQLRGKQARSESAPCAPGFSLSRAALAAFTECLGSMTRSL
jgi:hypothetical protein